jgi:hypothetical protein
MLAQAMATRKAEHAFVDETYGRADPAFFGKNCGGCHVAGCDDCHGAAHAVSRPGDDACLRCHNGPFVGLEYRGLAPRESHRRYQRGPALLGRHYLKMAPDVHATAGLGCASCHSMASLAAGEKASRTCVQCHQPSAGVLEHRIPEHLSRLECYACHSAWEAQEYGTFWIRLEDSPVQEMFALEPAGAPDYAKSVYLRRQDAPPLGVNARGRVSPIRPSFIAYFSHIRKDRPVGQENRLLAARWKAVFPHTVQRGTALCDACHGNARRFLLEAEVDRIYDLPRDGLGLASFWNREGQQMVNGRFLEPERYVAMSARSPTFVRTYVEKWKHFVGRVGGSSAE